MVKRGGDTLVLHRPKGEGQGSFPPGVSEDTAHAPLHPLILQLWVLEPRTRRPSCTPQVGGRPNTSKAEQYTARLGPGEEPWGWGRGLRVGTPSRPGSGGHSQTHAGVGGQHVHVVLTQRVDDDGLAPVHQVSRKLEHLWPRRSDALSTERVARLPQPVPRLGPHLPPPTRPGGLACQTPQLPVGLMLSWLLLRMLG